MELNINVGSIDMKHFIHAHNGTGSGIGWVPPAKCLLLGMP